MKTAVKTSMNIVVGPLSLALCLSAFSGCGQSVRGGDGGGGGQHPDLTSGFMFTDDGGMQTDDGGTQGPPNLCGDTDTSCIQNPLGPASGMPFPLKGDPMKIPGEDDQGVGRDPMGYIGLDQTHATFDFLWIANAGDWGKGTVSKINSKTVREVARYVTVTCYSLPTGSKMACDGTNGCCSADDHERFQARVNQQMQPMHQSVDQANLSPSRTAIDFNGDMFVANRAFGGQSSVTKIANDVSECKDRNKNGKIDTSNDANNDGLIQTDCNGDGVLDDLDNVKGKPCLNGAKQEFFGVDDECILWTTNTNLPRLYGRPLALGQGAVDVGPSDAWAGTYVDGKFFRIDGTTGLTKTQGQGPLNCYGAAMDSKGILWIAVLNDGKLGYIDSAKPVNTGVTRGATFALNAYGITMDRDQNVWEGGWTNGNAYRYTPDRTNGFANLGKGFWTQVTTPGSAAGASGNGRGIAADSRSANTYFVWMAKDGGWVSRITASAIPVPKNMDVSVDGSQMGAIRVAGSGTIGAGVDVEQNIWGVSQSGSVATRALVDKNGNITAPDTTSAPMGNNKCPAGDRCPLKDANTSEPSPYTYSDFTGFGLRNFTNPKGTYSYITKGCEGDPGDTQWYAVDWDADVPPSTSLTLHARTGKTPVPDMTWGPWTTNFLVTPADLRTNMPLTPFDKDDNYLQVEFIFTTMAKNATPKLKAFTIAFKCGKIG